MSNRFFIFLGAVFFTQHVFAGITYENNTNNSKQKSLLEKTAEEIKKVVPIKNLSDVNAHLIVEGASFRPFNLYMAPIKLTSSNPLYKKLANDIRVIIKRDFDIVNGFKLITHSEMSNREKEHALLKQKGAEGASRITLSIKNDIIEALVENKNLITGKESSHALKANRFNIRQISHLLAQHIYEEFIGPENIFLLQIAAIKADEANVEQVVLMDFDGHNEIALTKGPYGKSLPYFAPDGKSILYTVRYPQGQRIVEHDIQSNRIEFHTHQPGLNMEPRVLPNNSGLLVTLSFNGETNIYLLSRSGSKIVQKVTNNIGGLNLSPNISPDGKTFAYVSQMPGTPQIYIQDLNKNGPGKSTRLTFQGKYNQTPHFSPDGKYIAFTGRDEKGVFDIFLLRLKDNVVISQIAQNPRLADSIMISRITQNQGRNEGPHFTPSGRFVIFMSERERKRSDIFIASIDGMHQYRLTDASKSKRLGFYSPVVRPK